MKNDIFISYSRHDTNVVNEIVAMLEQEGYSVWIDRDGIESGEDFKRVILKAIKESEVILFFSSEHSNVSDWTAKEIGVAVKYRKHTIPIKLDDSNFNEAVEFDLINLDYIDYSKPTIRPAMREKLLKTLRNKLGPRNKEIERLEAERKAKEAAERLESERKAEQQRAEAKRKAEEARRKSEQERLERERAEVQRRTKQEAIDSSANPKPKLKKAFWIILGAIIVFALIVWLALSKKDNKDNVVRLIENESIAENQDLRIDTASAYVIENVNTSKVLIEPIDSTTFAFNASFWRLIHQGTIMMDPYEQLYRKYKQKVVGEEYDYLQCTILKDYSSYREWSGKLKQISIKELESINTIEELKRALL